MCQGHLNCWYVRGLAQRIEQEPLVLRCPEKLPEVHDRAAFKFFTHDRSNMTRAGNNFLRGARAICVISLIMSHADQPSIDQSALRMHQLFPTCMQKVAHPHLQDQLMPFITRQHLTDVQGPGQILPIDAIVAFSVGARHLGVKQTDQRRR